MFRFAENSRCRENEIPAFAGMEDIFYSTPIFYPTLIFLPSAYFLPSAACGGGCEREAVAGGGEMTMMGGVPPPPKNSLARIFTPPRKRRRVRQSAISLIPASDFHSAPSFHSRPLFHSCPHFHSCVGRNLCGDSRIRRQATIAMFRFAENSRCRENEIPAFAGMEGGRKSGEIKSIPIPAKAGISLSSNCFWNAMPEDN